MFAVTPTEADPAALEAFRARLGEGAGEPRSDDDGFAAKVERLLADPVAGRLVHVRLPGAGAARAVPRRRQRGLGHGLATSRRRATAAAAGADALVVQGFEAGGHRAAFVDEAPGDVGLLALLQLVAAAVPDLPLVATGGIATGRAVAAVLAAGAAAAQVGTAFMRCPEAGTPEVHREALARPGRTAVTRAFTGRSARGIVNAFMREHEDAAPHAYPAVHYVTAPLRARAREQGDADALHLWAGQAHELIGDVPAAELVPLAARRGAGRSGRARARGSARSQTEGLLRRTDCTPVPRSRHAQARQARRAAAAPAGEPPRRRPSARPRRGRAAEP